MTKSIHALEVKHEHPLAGTNPYSSEEQYELLKADIDANGVIVPIVFYRGLLVDGRHRVRACMELFHSDTGDGMVPYIDLPHKYSLAQVREHVASLETRRHQTKTQIVTGQWLDLVFNQKKSLRQAHDATGTSKDLFSKLNKIHEHFGLNTIKELRKGSQVTVSDSMRRKTTDSIGQLAKFISTIGEMEVHLSAVKDTHEEKMRIRTLEAEEWLATQDDYGIEAMSTAVAKLKLKRAR